MMNAAATSPRANSRSKHKPFSRQVTPGPGHFSSSFISSSSPSKHPLLGLSLSPNEKSDAHHHLHSQHQLPPSSSLGQCACCRESGVLEMLAALALMCLLSLLTAFLALFFLQRTTPVITVASSEGHSAGDEGGKGLLSHGVTQTRLSSLNMKEYLKVSQISLSLSTLTISLNLCCLFVCCIQFLSAAKLLKTPQGVKRAKDFFKRTSHVRIAAIGAFLISIPIFFTGVILFNFVNFDDTPALATSIVIGLGIIFCGVACVQTVYLWQMEKTKASQEVNSMRLSQNNSTSVIPIPLELSTLV